MNHDNAVKMVGHDDGGIDGDTREAGREVVPCVPNEITEGVAQHFSVDYLAKEGVAVLGAHGDVIQAGVGIIGGWMAQ